MNATDDAGLGRLMQAAQGGDGEAYAALLDAVVPRVRGRVRRERGFAGREDVEDIVQDVLLSLHAARATYDPARPFLPWLAAIVRHRLADGARRHARRAPELPVEDLDVTFTDTASNMTSGAVERARELDQAIAALPPGQRRAVELLKIRGLTLKEAAVVTGAGVGALKIATHRAIATLRRVLASRENHGH